MKDRAGWMLLLSHHRGEVPIVAPGSMVRMANCGHRSWISPEGVFMLDDQPGLYTCCTDCGIDILTDDQGAVERQMLPGSLASIERQWGVGAADQAAAWARDMKIGPYRGAL